MISIRHIKALEQAIYDKKLTVAYPQNKTITYASASDMFSALKSMRSSYDVKNDIEKFKKQ